MEEECQHQQVHEWRLDNMEHRLNRVEMFILLTLCLVATTTGATLWTAFVQPSNVYAEMGEALAAQIKTTIKEEINRR